MITYRGKPDPPENFQAQNVTSDRVLLSWDPGFDGGSPQFFRIRYMVKGSNEINTVDVLPTNASVFMITGLEPGTEYSFALMAWNVYGESGYTENEVVAQTTEGLGADLYSHQSLDFLVLGLACQVGYRVYCLTTSNMRRGKPIPGQLNPSIGEVKN
ncbi:Nephrin [Araneus ventricosus]|uniref:Nephrin n=1 Tax=Araneus ventricosus TaxID=182803 RepID=A0A4Y2B1L9_ARAVE|nr:Nephrin [Araneus ventricosus]